ncbi:MAG: ThuA domain-containing protein [Planctomycetia bacterium]|nr:ThuA domain-containing protein [Planctomycetia bacterium]
MVRIGFGWLLFWAAAVWSQEVPVGEITSGKPDGSVITVLIVDGQSNHNWRETTPVLKYNLEETGLFEVDVLTAPEKGRSWHDFQPDFGQYDAVVLNYNGSPWPDEVCQDLERYVAGGGGLVIYHSANNAFPQWSEYQKMIGVGAWQGRDERWGPRLYWENGQAIRDTTPGKAGKNSPQRIRAISLCEPNHPIVRGFPPRFMHQADELYEQLRGPAENVTILAGAAPDGSDGRRLEPVLMTIAYHQGRVFHITYGHAGTQCRSVAFIAPFVRGVQWAALGLVTIPVPPDMPAEERPFSRPINP